MSRRSLPLNAIDAFLVTARHLNLTHAAAELCLTQGAVSRKIASLEAWFGFPLFERHARGLRLSSQGCALLPELQSAFEHLLTVADQARSQQTVIRLKAPTCAMRWPRPMPTAPPPQGTRCARSMSPPSTLRCCAASTSGSWACCPPCSSPRRPTLAGRSTSCCSFRCGWATCPLCSRAFWSRWRGPGLPSTPKAATRLAARASRAAARVWWSHACAGGQGGVGPRHRTATAVNQTTALRPGRPCAG